MLVFRSVESLTCSPSVHVAFLRALLLPPLSQLHFSRWNVYAKLPLGINVCALGCDTMLGHSPNARLWSKKTKKKKKQPTLFFYLHFIQLMSLFSCHIYNTVQWNSGLAKEPNSGSLLVLRLKPPSFWSHYHRMHSLFILSMYSYSGTYLRCVRPASLPRCIPAWCPVFLG